MKNLLSHVIAKKALETNPNFRKIVEEDLMETLKSNDLSIDIAKQPNYLERFAMMNYKEFSEEVHDICEKVAKDMKYDKIGNDYLTDDSTGSYKFNLDIDNNQKKMMKTNLWRGSENFVLPTTNEQDSNLKEIIRTATYEGKDFLNDEEEEAQKTHKSNKDFRTYTSLEEAAFCFATAIIIGDEDDCEKIGIDDEGIYSLKYFCEFSNCVIKLLKKEIENLSDEKINQCNANASQNILYAMACISFVKIANKNQVEALPIIGKAYELVYIDSKAPLICKLTKDEFLEAYVEWAKSNVKKWGAKNAERWKKEIESNTVSIIGNYHMQFLIFMIEDQFFNSSQLSILVNRLNLCYKNQLGFDEINNLWKACGIPSIVNRWKNDAGKWYMEKATNLKDYIISELFTFLDFKKNEGDLFDYHSYGFPISDNIISAFSKHVANSPYSNYKATLGINNTIRKDVVSSFAQLYWFFLYKDKFYPIPADNSVSEPYTYKWMIFQLHHFFLDNKLKINLYEEKEKLLSIYSINKK